MSTIVYILCAITSAACALMLLRSYRERRVRLLLFSGLCFVGLALNNMLLIVDTSIITDVDLSLVRTLPALLGVGALVYSMIWDSK